MLADDQEGDEVDFAVLRMTLGIPGFDEKQLPRVVAILCAVLLLANRLYSPGEITTAQVTLDTSKVVLDMQASAMGANLRYTHATHQCYSSRTDPAALLPMIMFSCIAAMPAARTPRLAGMLIDGAKQWQAFRKLSVVHAEDPI